MLTNTRLLAALVALLAGCATMGAAQAPTAVFKATDAKRVFTLNAEVDGPHVFELANKMLAAADSDPNHPIDLLIASPGGSILAGNLLLDAVEAVKSRGNKVRCVVTTIAASMAFSVLDACSERYALRHAKLLFHPSAAMLPGVFGVVLRGKQAQELAEELNTMDEALLRHLLQSTGMAEAELREAFYKERLWDASDLAAACRKGYLNIIVDVQGLATPYNYPIGR